MPGQFSNRMGIGAVEHAAVASSAISVTNYHDAGLHIFNTHSDGGMTLALSDGTHKGQLTVGKLDVDGGTNVVVTPASFMDGTTITLDTANDGYMLMWDGTEWCALGTTTGTIA